jgi:acylphosphatase
MSSTPDLPDDAGDDAGHTPRPVRLDASVIGRVQGVGFRYFALREGMDLQLDGWVANAADGSVRCVAEGPRDRLEVLLERLREGPAGAIVDRVSEAWMPATGTLGPFSVRSGAHTGD